jgi:hypothetical protein
MIILVTILSQSNICIDQEITSISMIKSFLITSKMLLAYMHNVPGQKRTLQYWIFFDKENMLISRTDHLHPAFLTMQYPNGNTDAYSLK